MDDLATEVCRPHDDTQAKRREYGDDDPQPYRRKAHHLATQHPPPRVRAHHSHQEPGDERVIRRCVVLLDARAYDVPGGPNGIGGLVAGKEYRVDAGAGERERRERVEPETAVPND